MDKMFIILLGLALALLPQSEDFKIDFVLEKGEYLLGEPIMVTLTLTNVSGKEQSILFAEDSYAHTLQLAISDSRQNKIRALYPRIDFVLSDAKRNVKNGEHISVILDATKCYMLNKAGDFSVSALYECGGDENTWKGEARSAKKNFRIKDPVNDDDKNALELLMAGFFFDYSEEACKTILGKFPRSSYAQYARYYLAESDRKWMETGARTYVKKTFDEAIDLYTKSVDDKFTFSDEAQLGIAKCYVIKEDYETAAKEAQKVIDNFPNSNSVDEARELLKQITEQQAKKNIDTLKNK